MSVILYTSSYSRYSFHDPAGHSGQPGRWSPPLVSSRGIPLVIPARPIPFLHPLSGLSLSSTFLWFHWSHCTQLVIPAISVLGLYFLCCRYLTSHSGSSDTVAHHFYLVSTPFITFHHLSPHFITFHHIPSHSHLHSIHRLLTFPYLLHRFVSSWSFRPARYVLPHSYLPHTHTTPNGISLVIPAHQTPFTLHPSIVCFQISFRTLKAATCRPDVLPNTQ